ncbi:MAG: hypothetical protein ACFE9S_02795 [Candidatus Hermodarchaeota archaeon]
MNLIQIETRSAIFTNTAAPINRIPIKIKNKYNLKLKIAITIPITIKKRPISNRDDTALFILFTYSPLLIIKMDSLIRTNFRELNLIIKPYSIRETHDFEIKLYKKRVY